MMEFPTSYEFSFTKKKKKRILKDFHEETHIYRASILFKSRLSVCGQGPNVFDVSVTFSLASDKQSNHM